MSKPNLTILRGEFSIHQFEFADVIPEEVLNSEFFWIGKTNEELSVVCDAHLQLNSLKSDHNWAVIKIIGPFDLSVIGIMADISTVLAKAKISIFALSTYDTDYILVKKYKLEEAVEALRSEGYTIL